MNVRSTAIFIAVLLCSVLASAAEIRGRVVSALGGEPLARVQVRFLRRGRKSPLTATELSHYRVSPQENTLSALTPLDIASSEYLSRWRRTRKRSSSTSLWPPTTSVAQKKSK